MELECEYMTPLGCPARDAAKELMLQALIEGDAGQEMCRKMCCQDCDDVCGYRCGRVHEKEHKNTN